MLRPHEPGPIQQTSQTISALLALRHYGFAVTPALLVTLTPAQPSLRQRRPVTPAQPVH